MNSFEYKVPTFPQGPLKREMLLVLRDIAMDSDSTRYHGYSNGIIEGCAVIEEGMRIGVGVGTVKYADRLYRLKENSLLPYEPTEDWSVLKLRFSPQTRHSEYDHFTAELALDADTHIQANEMELGRFKLKSGSRLRTEYTDFRDMSTEFDTVNLVHTLYAARDTATLNPAITLHFAREAYKFAGTNPLDAAFCTACLSTNDAVGRELIARYTCTRLGWEYREMSNTELHSALADVLDLISGHGQGSETDDSDGGVLVIY